MERKFSRRGPKDTRRFKRRRSLVARSRFSIPRTIRARPLVLREAKEPGYVDLAYALHALNTTGSIVLVATVAQGVGVTQRVGKKIMWKSMQLRGNAFANATATVATGAAMLVYDRRPTGALPVITDILVTASPQSFLNDTNSGRFNILRRWDWTFVGNNTTAGQSTAKTSYIFNEFVNLRGKKGIFKAAGTGAIGDIEQGAIYLVTVGNAAAGTTDADLAVGIRTRFIDV